MYHFICIKILKFFSQLKPIYWFSYQDNLCFAVMSNFACVVYFKLNFTNQTLSIERGVSSSFSCEDFSDDAIFAVRTPKITKNLK